MFRMNTKLFRMNTNRTESERVAESVRVEMDKQHISQRRLAEQTGIPVTTLHRKLKGASPFTTTDIALIARELGTSMTAIIAAAEMRAAA